MFFNYFYIVGVISTFNLDLSSDLITVTNIIGSNIDFTTYNIECFLSDMYN